MSNILLKRGGQDRFTLTAAPAIAECRKSGTDGDGSRSTPIDR